MKSILSIAILAFAANASALTSTESLSCSQAQATVRAHGSIKLQAGETYEGRPATDVFHANASSCRGYSVGALAWVPTTSGSCLVGYVCRGDIDGDDSQQTVLFKASSDYHSCIEGQTRKQQVQGTDDEYYWKTDICVNGRWVSQPRPTQFIPGCTEGKSWSEAWYEKEYNNDTEDWQNGQYLGVKVHTCINWKYQTTHIPQN